MRIAYRPEIDGLRAISVFAVILYHANLVLFGHTLFQGGFIGVDIFFVISGYVITALILQEILRTNQFSFKNFYERRIRRILPVLLFVTIITSIISYFILLPSSLIDFSRSVLSIIFFSSNFYFNYTGNNYGEESTLLKPLLHTWSLSVEGQFYILFPIFLIIIIKFFRKHLITILLLSFLISLFFSAYCSRWHPGTNFYQLPSRVFELLTGSLLYYYELKSKKNQKSYSIFNKMFPSLGIMLILYSFFFLDFNKIFHPSIITLIPLVGVSLIILFSKKGELVTKILSNKAFVFFGLISFSLYLWHYPIFAFLRYIDVFNSSIQIKLLAILLTIILSILSFYFIERPFRNKNIISVATLTAYILIIVIILLSYIFYILKTDGNKNKFPNIISEELKRDLKENELNKINGNLNNLILIGDSHADALTYHLNQELVKQSYNFYRISNDFYLKNFNQINRKNGEVSKTYFENNKKISEFLETNKNLIVVLHNRWSIRLLENYFNNNEGFYEYQSEKDKYIDNYLEPIKIKTETINQRQKYIIEGIKLSIKDLLDKGHTLILVYPVPEMGFDVPRLFLRHYSKMRMINKNFPILTTSYEVYKDRNKIIFNTLDNINHSNIYRIYPHEFFCNTLIINRCVANNEKHLFYNDDDHLSLEGSKYIVNNIMKVIQKIEIKKN